MRLSTKCRNISSLSFKLGTVILTLISVLNSANINYKSASSTVTFFCTFTIHF